MRCVPAPSIPGWPVKRPGLPNGWWRLSLPCSSRPRPRPASQLSTSRVPARSRSAPAYTCIAWKRSTSSLPRLLHRMPGNSGMQALRYWRSSLTDVDNQGPLLPGRMLFVVDQLAVGVFFLVELALTVIEQGRGLGRGIPVAEGQQHAILAHRPVGLVAVEPAALQVVLHDRGPHHVFTRFTRREAAIGIARSRRTVGSLAILVEGCGLRERCAAL